MRSLMLIMAWSWKLDTKYLCNIQGWYIISINCCTCYCMDLFNKVSAFEYFSKTVMFRPRQPTGRFRFLLKNHDDDNDNNGDTADDDVFNQWLVTTPLPMNMPLPKSSSYQSPWECKIRMRWAIYNPDIHLDCFS